MIDLLPHNIPTYEELCKQMENHNKCALVQATGTGKSYIIAKYLEEHPGKSLILVPTNAIGSQWEKLLSRTDCDFTVETYRGMSMHIEDEASYDIVVADEMHHLGSEIWGNAFINRFIQNVSQKVIGTTATEIRYLDNSRDMVKELFNGVAARGCDLRTAIEKEILPTFTYVSVWYGNDKDYEEYADKAKKIRDKTNKEQVLGKLELCKQNQKSIEQAIKENLSDEPHKIIVFLNSIDSVSKTEKHIKKAFSANKTYKINSKMGKEAVSKNIAKFQNGNDRISVLFAIDMLNEGVHIEGVDTVAFFRSTKSPSIYFQQLGRCLEANHKNHERIVFDFVCNSSSIESIYDDDNRDTIGAISKINRGLSSDKKIIIKSYTKELIELFNEIEQAINRKKITQEEITFVKENTHLTAQELAKALNRPIATIWKIVKENKIKIKKAVRRYNEDEINAVIQNSEKTYDEISKITGVSPATIGAILQKYGYDKRREWNYWTNEQIEIIQDVLLSDSQIAQKIGKSEGAVAYKRRSLGISSKERMKKAVCLLYDNGESIKSIEERLDICHSTARKILIENDRIKKQEKKYGGKSRRIAQIEDGILIKIYKNAIEAAKDNGFHSPGKLNQAARKGSKSHGYYWKYIEEE